MKIAKCFKSILLLVLAVSFCFSVVACGIDGVDGAKGEKGDKGDNGVGITKIEKTSSNGNTDIYTIVLSDGQTYNFNVTNGEEGANGADGKDGANGLNGVDGKDGKNGTSITNVALTSSQNGVDTYTIYLDNDTTHTFMVTNGVDGKDGAYISSIEKTATAGYTDTYTITMSNKSSFTFNVINGKSAFDLAVENGYKGTVEEWLASLVGENGTNGKDGMNGENGKSAYELAVENGYKGTEQEWLASLIGQNGTNGKDGINGEKGDKGDKGDKGEQGLQGEKGENGANGKSAYELAVENGYSGSLTDWLTSLVGKNGEKGENGTNGKDGANGKSAYDLAVENGYTGSVAEWLVSLAGANGEKGEKGENGTNGKSAYELAVENGYSGSLTEWLTSLVGKNGENGTDGTNGKSAYELAVENGYTGTEQEWLLSLKGNQGEQGLQGEKGDKGEQGAQGVGVQNAYVNGDLHLILVLTDGTEIDAGYVGVEVAPTAYTVTFKDFDGTILSSQQVEKGASATAPSAPQRQGYIFAGWSTAFNNVTSNLEVMATYTKIEQPTLVVSSATVKAGGKAVITLDVVNNPGIMNAVLTLHFNDTVLSVSSVEKGSALSASTLTKPKYFVDGCNFVFDGLDITNTEDGNILTFTFDVPSNVASGTVFDISITYVQGDICDGNLVEKNPAVIAGKIIVE